MGFVVIRARGPVWVCTLTWTGVNAGGQPGAHAVRLRAPSAADGALTWGRGESYSPSSDLFLRDARSLAITELVVFGVSPTVVSAASI